MINKETALMLFIEIGLIVFLLYLNVEAETLSKIAHPEVLKYILTIIN